MIIYARVSTREQNIDMQLVDLRQYAEVRKLKLVREYLEKFKYTVTKTKKAEK